MPARIAIIGAGISGLAAARELVAAGHDVEVFEAADRAGGLLEAESIDGFLIERAASSFVPAEYGAEELCVELGVALEDASSKARKRWVYIDGELQEVPSRATQLLSSPLLSWRGKFRALAEPLQPNNPGADESIAAFCSRRLGDEVTRALISPFVMGVFGGDARVLSLRACFPRLAELEARGGLVRGVAANKVEAVLSRMQGAASSKRGHRIVAPKAGATGLIEALAASLGDRIHYGTSIASIEREGREQILHDANGQHHHADVLVLATPAPVTASLVEPYDAEMARTLLEIPYAPMCVAALGYRGRVSHPLDGFGFLVAEDESPRILGAVFESSVWSGRAPAGGALVRCMLGGAGDPEILELSDQEIADRAVADLGTTLGLKEEPDLRHVIRWPRAIPQYTIGHVERAKRIEAGASALGIVVASNALWGISVNECIAKAKKVVQQVAARAGLALLVLATLAQASACGPKNKGAANLHSDAGSTQANAPAQDPDASVVAEPGMPSDRGKVEIFARWLWPPAELRRSPGRNACGLARSPALEVELMGGLHDVVVSSTEGQGPSLAELAIHDCRIEPRLVALGLGQSLVVTNMDETPHELVIERLDDKGAVAEQLGRMPMRVIGHRYGYQPSASGVLRLHSQSDPQDYAYVLVTEGAAAVSSERGTAALELSPGAHVVSLWHPPVRANGPGLRASVQVDIAAQKRQKRTVDLGKPQ